MTVPRTDGPTVTAPISARVFLVGEDSVATLAARMRESRALDETAGLPALGRATRRLLDDQVATAADSFIDIDLGRVVVAGWRTHQQLVAAARDTAATPGLVSVVPLASHTIEASWRPRVEVVVGDAPVVHLGFQLTLGFTLTALSLGVEDGRLVRLTGGPGRVAAQFLLGGQLLAERSAGYDAELAIPLGRGISLLDGEHELGRPRQVARTSIG